MIAPLCDAPALSLRPTAFRAPVSYSLSGTVGEIVAADIDGDGYRDIAAINGSNVSVLFNKGDGTFNAPLNVSIDAGAAHVVAVDLNGDTKKDLVVTSPS